MEETLKILLKRLKLHEGTISMILGALVIVVVGTVLYNFLRSTEPASEETQEVLQEEYALELVEEEGQLVPQGLPVEHVVNPGEHLWGISERYYGNGYNWIDIATANTLTNPNLIFRDQKLTIPRTKLRVREADEFARASVAAASTISGDTYTVIKGDTLWRIAVRAYQDGYQWPKLYEANRETISDPHLIEVGMVLQIPR